MKIKWHILFCVCFLNIWAMAQTRLGNPVKVKLPFSSVKSLDKDYSSPSLKDGQLPNRGCITPAPGKEWDEWFNKKVAEYSHSLANERTTSNTYTITVVFHVLSYTASGSVPVGTYPNLSQAQVNSQISILNADYAGVGFNSCQYAKMMLNGHGPFYDYAVANNLPSPDNNGTIISNTGITFCLAAFNPTGGAMAEPGIDRVNTYTLSGHPNPASPSSYNAFQSLIDNNIKPHTIWDPTRYFNVWVSDCNSSLGILGYSTFPGGTSLTGLSGGGSGNATPTTDGCWVWAHACGNIGSVAPPYNLGRTLTHESGHYLGLRHIWGDGSCATDYCNDTPPASAANYVPWPTVYPYHVGTCTGNPNNSTDGELFMTFMDYSDDAAMWMFTNDQLARMHAAYPMP